MSVSKEEVAKLYVATFNRAPDNAGLDYWVNESGLSIEGIAQSFFDQEETKTIYDSLTSNTDFVNAIYQNLFNRDAEQAGLDYWVGELNAGRTTRDTSILAFINGALNSDATTLVNKQAVGLDFAAKGLDDVIQARDVMANITSDTSSVNDAIALIQRQFRPSLDALLAAHTDTINVTYDPSLSGTELQYVQDYFEKITAVFDEYTGFSPHKSITIKLNTSEHIGFNSDDTILNLDVIPSQDDWFMSRFTVNIAHLYFHEQGDGNVREIPLYENTMRSGESNSQTLASIIGYAYGDALGWSDIEKNFYSTDFNNEWYSAFSNLLVNSNPFSIYQTDTNYGMNSTALSATTHDLISLYKLDKDFYKNMLSSQPSWQSFEEYKDVITNAIHTMSYEEAKTMVDSLGYFKQVDALANRPDMNIEIALFSTTDFPTLTSNKWFALDSADSYIIYGQSNNAADNPLGTDVWDIAPDPELYDSTAVVKLYDSDGLLVYTNNTADIKTDFANGWSGSFKNIVHNGETYTITAEATINGVLLTDSQQFTYFI